MKFEWDVDKIKVNLEKHGIDFEAAKNLWLDENRVEIHAPYPVEDRNILIGKQHERLWAAVYTIRGDMIRIISVRRARRREVDLYEKEVTGQK